MCFHENRAEYSFESSLLRSYHELKFPVARNSNGHNKHSSIMATTDPIDMNMLRIAVNSNVSDVNVLKTYMNSNLIAARNPTIGKGHIMCSAANTSTCGYVSTSGVTYMWGANGNGQLGNNSLSNSQLPVPINTFGSLGSNSIISLSCGGTHTIALSTTGIVHAWGANSSGQLGNNTVTQSTIPIKISTFGSLSSNVVTSIACGASYSLAVDTNGAVHSWGYNYYGNLGNNTTTLSKIPVNISAFGSLASNKANIIWAGNTHSIAIDTAGIIHAWGNNNCGQLGNSTLSNSWVPKQISSFGSIVSKTIKSISGGSAFTVALDTTGQVHSWGYNGNRELGDGTAVTQSTIPILISTFGSLVSKTVTSISCGGNFTTALDTTGQVHAWGNNNIGQLGINSTAIVTIPTLVSTFGSLVSASVVSVASGSSHTMALDATGAIHTWGLNGSGQLGNGTLTNSIVPILLPNSTSFTNFTGQHRCFVSSYSNNLSQIEGLIVCANKNNKYNTTSVPLGGDSAFTVGLSAITINDSLPIVSLAQKTNDRTVFGVVSLKPNVGPNTPEFNPAALSKVGDLRAEINSVGEGAMWVSDVNGPFSSGDYVTSSVLPGYGAVQNDDFLHNYTVAKVTMSCDFDTSKTQVKLQRRVDFSGNNVLGDDGLPIFDPVLDSSSNVVLEPLFQSRLLDSSGNIIEKDEQERLRAAGSNTYTAAFVGCTYHCG